MKGNFQVRFLGEGKRGNTLPLPDNMTSQFWANCYLSGFDHFVKRELRCQGYVRYVDDMLLFGDDKRQLWAWKRAVIDRLAGLRLTIHVACAQVRPVTEGFPYLGFVLYPHKRRLKRRKGVAYARKLRGLAEAFTNSRRGPFPAAPRAAVRGAGRIGQARSLPCGIVRAGTGNGHFIPSGYPRRDPHLGVLTPRLKMMIVCGDPRLG